MRILLYELHRSNLELSSWESEGIPSLSPMQEFGKVGQCEESFYASFTFPSARVLVDACINVPLLADLLRITVAAASWADSGKVALLHCICNLHCYYTAVAIQELSFCLLVEA